MAHAAPWDTARPGSSALQAAIARASYGEASTTLGLHIAAVLWDFEKFIHSIDTEVLIQHALDTGYPITDLLLGLQVHGGPRLLQLHKCALRPLFRPSFSDIQN